MHPGLIVFGTDTGVGKTFVSAGLLHDLRGRGFKVSAVKPVETGFEVERWSSDARLLAMAADEVFSPDHHAPLRLRAALAPMAAAREEGMKIDAKRWLQAVQSRLVAGRVQIVESTGGVRVPVAPGMSNLELGKALGLPALVVARNGLGTINHTVLSCEAVRAAGIPLLGFVLNGHADASARRGGGNAHWIEEGCGAPCLGELPQIVATPAPIDAASALRWLSAAATAVRHLDWTRLLGGMGVQQDRAAEA